jgi:hypothetical protein
VEAVDEKKNLTLEYEAAIRAVDEQVARKKRALDNYAKITASTIKETIKMLAMPIEEQEEISRVAAEHAEAAAISEENRKRTLRDLMESD